MISKKLRLNLKRKYSLTSISILPPNLWLLRKLYPIWSLSFQNHPSINSHLIQRLRFQSSYRYFRLHTKINKNTFLIRNPSLKNQNLAKKMNLNKNNMKSHKNRKNYLMNKLTPKNRNKNSNKKKKRRKKTMSLTCRKYFLRIYKKRAWWIHHTPWC